VVSCVLFGKDAQKYSKRIASKSRPTGGVCCQRGVSPQHDQTRASASVAHSKRHPGGCSANEDSLFLRGERPHPPTPGGGTSSGVCLEESRLLRKGHFLTSYVIGVSLHQWFLKNSHRSPVA
jgi:hypothetical protein